MPRGAAAPPRGAAWTSGSPARARKKRGSPAGTLLANDHMDKMMNGSHSLSRDKSKGLLPTGNHSCFGDFPPEHMVGHRFPGAPRNASAKARPQSAGAFGGRTSF